MFTITNLDRVNQVFESNEPRPIRDIMLEIYPDATEDCNGRFHAPYDGYICPLTGKEFRAGEYLPNEEDSAGSKTWNARGMDLGGNIHNWVGTRAQIAAVNAELLAQSRAKDAETSEWLGKVGGRITAEVVVQALKAYPNPYGGTTWFHVLKDTFGNVIFAKISKKLGGSGDKLNISAKVKSHQDRDGVKQTIVNYVKVV